MAIFIIKSHLITGHPSRREGRLKLLENGAFIFFEASRYHVRQGSASQSLLKVSNCSLPEGKAHCIISRVRLATNIKKIFWPICLSLFGLAQCIWVLPRESQEINNYIIAFPDTNVFAQQLRLPFLAILFFLPAVGAWLYHFSGCLDRYLTRQFLTIFLLSLGALLGILVISDFQNHVDEFYQSQRTLNVALSYYAIFVPSVIVFIFPYALLISLLYCLGKMSRHQEIVSMMQTGRGIFRIAQPLIIVGLFVSLMSLIYNYHWGPVAEAKKKNILSKAWNKDADRANSVLYRDVASKRVWFVDSFPHNFEKSGMLRRVLVTSFDDAGNLRKKLKADYAHWSRQDGKWRFSGAEEFDPSFSPIPQKIISQDPLMKNWSETPWQIIKPGLDYTQMGTPDLIAWLAQNQASSSKRRLVYLTQWHHRIAQALICLVTVLLATPLGVNFSRKGIASGVSLAFFLSGGMLFFTNFFLSLGESGKLPPVIAAWGTNIIFTLIAFYLFKRRISGLPIFSSMKNLISPI